MFYTSLVLCLWTLVGVFGDDVKSVSVMEGHSVTLNTNITEIKRGDEIEWWFGNISITRIEKSDINLTYKDINETQIFRGRVKINNQTGDLTITNIRTEDSGLYQLNILIGNNPQVKRFFNVTVNVSPTVSITESTQNTSDFLNQHEFHHDEGERVFIFKIIELNSYRCVVVVVVVYTPSGRLQSVHMVVICCAVVGCLMIVASVLIFWIYRKHKNTQQQDQTCEDEITYADPTFYKRNTKTKRVEEDDVVYAGVVTRR
ncbi:uncharacterized protein [Misgurnus anguillicaudatus]|uniref:uncharacterized protein isoform X1 n=1 Tax=Misgurnus anguillicaudatus TaxID=75329 RepID=UPI003CCF1B9C